VGVSVIIPTFNCAATVTDAVRSALAQTRRAEEIIVVDDGSTDDTRERLKPYADRVRYIAQENGGVAAARNRGLAAARGDLLAFLDADDVWHPQKLELQLRAMAERRDILLLGTATFPWPAHQIPPAEPRGPSAVAPIAARDLLVRNYFTTSSVVLRREAAERAGLFDTALSGPEDYDYWLRVSRVGPVANLSLPLTGYRDAAGSLSRRADAMEAGLHRVLRKLDECDGWNGERWRRRRAYGYASYSCAYLHGAAGRQGAALRRIVRSWFWYPLPYRRGETGAVLARPRRAAVLLLRLLRLLPPDPLTAHTG
jgi:glycosyltransferase involved in cell wall biosynthesis